MCWLALALSISRVSMVEESMNILIFSGIYALNIVDAYVDAHLKEFDINDNLSFKVKPLFYATNYSHLATGLTLSIRLK